MTDDERADEKWTPGSMRCTNCGRAVKAPDTNCRVVTDGDEFDAICLCGQALTVLADVNISFQVVGGNSNE